MTIVLTLISMAAIFVVAGYFAKRSKRGRKSAADREKQIADLLASAHAEARIRQRGDDVLPALVTNAAKSDTAKKQPPRLLSNVELRLHAILVEAMPALLVFPHIRFSQHQGVNEHETGGSSDIDFLICRAADSSIVAAVQLSGSSRRRSEKQTISFEATDIPLVVVNAENMPDIVSLRKMIAPHVLGRQNPA